MVMEEMKKLKKRLFCPRICTSTVQCFANDFCVVNSNFIDSGATIDGVSPQFCATNGLWDRIEDYNEPMEIALAAKLKMTVPTKTITLTVYMEHFEPYTNDFLVIDVPEKQDILLGMPWLKTVNPDIDWVKKRVNPRVKEGLIEYFKHGYYSATSGITKFITSTQFGRMLKKPKTIECIFVIRPKTEK
ncbi:Hypothetical protein PHPALM_173 [Phytophthora palmivora]|uniref:Uncharacterized protein n=1 Tax=Phytophthora palmivora TaxID=4796 RepID=A0A2P4YVI7_9STRA|nr:Hypothetical protein PHPALM_173 [Phytophthora palmivora]